MKVTVDLDDRVWAQLASKADGRGVKVGDLLVEALTSAVAPKHRSRLAPVSDPARREEIRRFHGLHFSADEIAKRLGYRADTVRSTLMDLGLTKGKR